MEGVDIYGKALSNSEYIKRNILQNYIGRGQQGLSGAAARTGDLRKERNVKKRKKMGYRVLKNTRINIRINNRRI